MKSRNPSGFYMAWVVGNVTIIAGILSIMTILLLAINATRALSFRPECPFGQYNSRYTSEAITTALLISSGGYILLYLRKRALKKTLVQHEQVNILSDFAPKNRSIMGYLGGAVTILGLIWMVFSSVQFALGSERRWYCENNPYDSACVYDSPFPIHPCEEYWVEEIFTTPHVMGIFVGFLIFPMFAGQMLVVVPHATRRDDTPSEG